MVLYDWFDHQYFSRTYLRSSKYRYKENLLDDFYGIYWRCTTRALTGARLNWVRDDMKNPSVKKNMRRFLTDYGYTKAAIDGIFKVCNACIRDQLS